MAGEIQYHTKQQEKLLGYLKTITGQHITAQEICSHFATSDSPIGLTTVYRQLERLISEGLVQKYIIDGSSACFSYIGVQDKTHEICFHCKCVECGKLIHLECGEIQHLQEHILDKHDFTLDTTRTVFYGWCNECRE